MGISADDAATHNDVHGLGPIRNDGHARPDPYDRGRDHGRL